MTTSVIPWLEEITSIVGPSIKGITVYRSGEQPPSGKCIVIYGKPGVGKTELASQAADSPHGAPVLYLNLEGGAWSLSHRDDITIVDILTFRQFVTVAQGLFRARTLSYKSIIIDSTSELQAMSVVEILGAGGGILGTSLMTQQNWGKSTADMLMIARGFHDLARRTGTHVIFTALEDLGKDAGEVSYRRGIGFTPSLAKSFPAIVDIVGHLTVKNDAPHYTRVLNFAANPLSDAKFRRSKAPEDLKIPLTIAYRQQPVMADILNVLAGGMDWPTDKYKALQAQATVTQVPVSTDNDRAASPNPVEASITQKQQQANTQSETETESETSQ